MRLLLDTHVFLWAIAESPLLKPAMRRVVESADQVYVSAASIWEIAIKRRVGKLAFEGSPVDAVGKNAFLELQVSGRDCEAAGTLDWPHADPFDRLILAQAQARALTLITADAAMCGFIGVAIIAMLAAFAYQKFFNASEKAKEVKDETTK